MMYNLQMLEIGGCNLTNYFELLHFLQRLNLEVNIE